MRLDSIGAYPRPQERPPPPCGGSLEELVASGVDFFGEFAIVIVEG